MLLAAVEVWTLVGVFATATFTAATVLVTWLAYQHGRTDTGRGKPLVLRGAFKVPLLIDNRWWWAAIEEQNWHKYRVFDLHILNRSAVFQILRMHGGSVLWPRLPPAFRKLRVTVEEDMKLDPYAGGNVELLINSPTGEWPVEKVEEDEWLGQWYRRRYLVKMYGETASGHRVRYFGLVRLRYFKGRKTHKFESATVDYGHRI